MLRYENLFAALNVYSLSLEILIVSLFMLLLAHFAIEYHCSLFYFIFLGSFVSCRKPLLHQLVHWAGLDPLTVFDFPFS